MAKKEKIEPKKEIKKVEKKVEPEPEQEKPIEKVWNKEFDDKLTEKYHGTVWSELEPMFKPFTQTEIRKRAKELNL